MGNLEHYFRSEKRSLYPERASANLDSIINELDGLEKGTIKKIEIAPEEREAILRVDNELGEELEKINAPQGSSFCFYLEYLLTPEGRQDFFTSTGGTLTAETTQEVAKQVFAQRELLRTKPLKELLALTGRSASFADKRVEEALASTMAADGTISTDNIDVSIKLPIVFNPKIGEEKIARFRAFKQKIKTLEKEIGTQLNLSENGAAVAHGVLELYRKKLNVMLVDTFDWAYMLKKGQDLTGEPLDEGEQQLFKQFKDINVTDLSLSRMDKFIHGASAEYDAQGYRQQISKEIAEFTDKLEVDNLDTIVHMREKMRAKGLDPEKILAKTLPIEECQKLAEETLDAYGLLSKPPSDYDPAREGPAPDKRWQFVAKPEYNIWSVNGKQKIVASSTRMQSAFDVFPILIGHEIEGHVLQNENTNKIPLRLFKKLGGDRTSLMGEGGAMMNENIVSQEAFGYKSIVWPHYIRTMVRKLEGGNYLDCVKTFYQSALKEVAVQRDAGQITEEQIINEAKGKLRLAVNRAKRLFRGGDFESTATALAKSKDTVYLEQIILLEKLKARGLERYAFLGGANLKTIAFLVKSGFLKIEDIQAPKYYALEIWDRVKDQYKPD